MAWCILFRVSKSRNYPFPYQDNAFKLYGLDVVLLAAQSGLDAVTLLEGNRVFTEFKDALTKQYVLQQLITMQNNFVFYWEAEKGSTEVDFVLQRGQGVIPIEVKAKSLKAYVEQFELEQAVLFSRADYWEQGQVVNVPLYRVKFF